MDGKHNTDKTNAQIEFQGELQGIQAKIELWSGKRKPDSPFVGAFVKPPKKLIKAFSYQIPLASQRREKIELFVKLYQKRADCDNEVEAWNIVRQLPHFHLVPAVLPKSHKVKILSGKMKNQDFFCIVMEKAKGKVFNIWFNEVLDDVPNPPVAFHQFFSVWFQLFHLLKFLHLDCNPTFFYHADIKPDNLRFRNNSLRLIDFNASTNLTRSSPYGTAQYAPSRTIKGIRPIYETDYEVHTGFFDLYCAGVTLLEVFTSICVKWGKENKNTWFYKLSECFKRKEKLSNSNSIKDEKKWEGLIKENRKIQKLLDDWKKSNSIIAKMFSLLLDETYLEAGNNNKLSSIYNDLLLKSKQKYIKAAMKDIDFQDKTGSLRTRLRRTFPKLLSKLLTNYSRNIFSYLYPLLYLDYSNNTMGYDEQAKLALKSVETYAKSLRKESCLDVGCAFGTAALRASRSGFKRITCLDNNPYFDRLADLLWRPGDPKLYDVYFPRAKDLFVAIYGEDGEKQILNLVSKYNKDFLENESKRWVYWLADYWSLAIEEKPKNKFDCIICNNFLHWPVIDFQNMNKECSNFYYKDKDLGMSGLEDLLFPLLSHLKKNGCLVIVEPSQFFEDDLHKDEDTAFYEKRFTNQPIYKAAQDYARSTLANDIFKFEIEPIEFRKRETKFLSSFFKKLEDQGYKVDIIPEKHYHECDWRSTIIGEFNMTLRKLTDIQIQTILSDEMRHIQFYKEFRNYLEKLDIPNEPPLETIYIAVITKN